MTDWPVFEVCIAVTGFVRALCCGHADITGAALHRYLPGLGLEQLCWALLQYHII